MPARFVTPDHYQELLSAETQARDDVDLLVERAEMLVLDRFTEGIGLDRTVTLDGYDPDPEVCDEELARRIRITVALVAEHMATAPDSRIRQMVRGERSVTYAQVRRALPPGWDGLLRDFDTSAPIYRI